MTTEPPETPSDAAPRSARIALVTGPSGAGRSTAINALEDMGFEAIDNLPLTLLPRLLDGRPLERPLALGIDTRNRDFSVRACLEAMDNLAAQDVYQGSLLYLDCRDDVLVRRYSETRRRHPFAPTGTPAAGIERELAILGPLRERADILIDTSELSPHDLRAALARRFAGDGETGLAISLQSFSYKRGLPQELDCAFDVRFLANPHWVEDLRPLDGRDPAVVAHITADPVFETYFAKLADLVLTTLSAFADEGKTHLSIGLGCTGGKHRSVAVTEKLANTLAEAGWRVSIRHRELERGTRPGDI
ncbi:MAG: RNase adapter RapZ [Rhodobacteraceae bacterium]|nr:RNase adapter RapZ [Alphaproteobacteria bacterium]NNK68464.1 RNase adapter RapZ [Paracoccaceae bacterium]